MGQNNWSNEILAYAAGFLDGEGCFSVDKSYKIRISCANTNRPIIEWFQQTFGGSFCKNATRRRNPRHRRCYSWSIVANDAQQLLRAIVPFLKEKAEQALLLMFIQQTKTKGGPGSVSSILLEERNYLVNHLKELKHVAW